MTHKYTKVAEIFQGSVNKNKDLALFMTDTLEKVDQLIKLVSNLRQDLQDRMSDGLNDLRHPIDQYMACIHVDKESFSALLAVDEQAANFELKQTLEKHEKENEGFTEYLKKSH